MGNKKIVIDVVLLLPEEIRDLAIKINGKLVLDKIILNKKNCLPHISLCMGVVEEKRIPEIREILSTIATSFSPLPLTITGISERHSSFNIAKTAELQHLHEIIMNKLEPYCTYNAKIAMCYSPPAVEKKTLFWINNYKKTSFENFYPHITLAMQKMAEQKLNVPFIASTLALCHLGNYCTCRKILYSTELH